MANPGMKMETTARPSILGIIDFSESSKDILKWAIAMAAKLKVHLTILHPYRLNQLDKKENMVGLKRKLDVDAFKNFEVLANGLLSKQKISFDFRSEVGFIQDRVQDYAQRNTILFLVIGADQVTANHDTLEEMVREIGVPMVVVPPGSQKE